MVLCEMKQNATVLWASFSRCLFERSVFCWLKELLTVYANFPTKILHLLFYSMDNFMLKLEKTLTSFPVRHYANLDWLISVLQSMFICPIQYLYNIFTYSTVSQSTVLQSTILQSTVSFCFAKYCKPYCKKSWLDFF